MFANIIKINLLQINQFISIASNIYINSIIKPLKIMVLVIRRRGGFKGFFILKVSEINKENNFKDSYSNFKKIIFNLQIIIIKRKNKLDFKIKNKKKIIFFPKEL